MFTALLIAILIVAGAATAVGGGLILTSQRKRQLGDGGGSKQLAAGDPDALLERTIGDLRVGDVVQTGDRDFLVEGLVRYDEAGHQWLAGRLVDDRDVRWLVVGLERSGNGDARIYELDEDVDVSGYPPEVLVVGATRYNFEKRGTATAKLVGDVGTLAGRDPLDPSSVHRCRWWLYQAAGDPSLLVEQWGDDYRVLRGHRVGATELELIPGS